MWSNHYIIDNFVKTFGHFKPNGYILVLFQIILKIYVKITECYYADSPVSGKLHLLYVSSLECTFITISLSNMEYIKVTFKDIC